MKPAPEKPAAPASPQQLLPEIRRLIEDARQHAVSAANLSMVALYWNIGRIIATEIQETPRRAGYGRGVMATLAAQLVAEYGKGFSAPNLWDMRRFFEAFQIGQDAPIKSISTSATSKNNILQPVARESSPERGNRLLIVWSTHFHLGWTHYRILLGLDDPRQRRFYFEQTASQRWSKRELFRQMDRGLFERVALSPDTADLVTREKKNGPPELADYRQAFKDPYLLDFLGLTGAYSERDLESAILANLQQFLIELGGEFCFIRRQFPMRVDDTDYFLDLLFYHRGLRCLVAVDLKLGAFTAADKGQMDLYLAWLKEHEWREGENEPVGLILCTSTKKQHVELLLRHGPHKLHVSEYRTQLPARKLLEDRLKLYGRMLAEQDQETTKFKPRRRGLK